MILAMSDESEPMEPHHRHTVRRVILSSQLILAVLTAVAVAIGYQQLNGNIGDGEEISHSIEPPEDVGEKGPLNILVMGSDSREGEANDLESEGTDRRALRHHDPDPRLGRSEGHVRRQPAPRRRSSTDRTAR